MPKSPAELIAEGGKSPEQVAQESSNASAAVVEESQDTTVFNEDAFSDLTGEPIDTSVVEQRSKELEEEEKKAAEREAKTEDEKADIDTGAPDVIPEGDQEPVEREGEPKVEVEGTTVVPATAKVSASLDEELELNDIEKGLLKKMASDAREFTSARLKELKHEKSRRAELEEKLKNVDQPPEQWYENEDAYIHLPEVKKASRVVEYAKSLQAHYMEQLKKVRNGENWTEVLVGADGKLQHVNREAATDSDIVIADRIAEARLTAQTYSQQIQQVQSTFKQRAKSVLNGVQQAEDEFFPQYSDPKVAESNTNIKFMMDALKAKGAGGNMLNGFIAKMYAEYVSMQQELSETKSQLKGKKQVKTLEELAQPSADAISSGGGGKPKETDPDKVPFRADAFEELTGVKL
jgi:hypothetical protein